MNINELHLNELRRFAELGRLSATLIHEISHPLTAALLNLELSDSTSPAIRQAHRNMQVLRRYVESARRQLQPHNQSDSFTLAAQVRQIKHILLPLAKQAKIKLVIVLPPEDILMWGNPIKFQQIINNLVINALQAYKDNTPLAQRVVKLEIRIVKQCLVIEVTDWGRGIAAAKLQKVFEPFYTTKQRGGLGLGLAIAKQHITADFNGSIAASSSKSAGTKFTASLPLLKTHVLK